MPIVLLEREASQVSRLWKYSQILFHLIAFLGSIISCIPFEKVRSTFHGNCVLNAHLSLMFQEGRVKVNEDPGHTKWGSNTSCSFCLYSIVASAIYSFVFGWFYAMCPRGGRPTRWEYSPRKPWRLVFPSLVFSCNFSIVLAVVSTMMVNGVAEFCKGLTAQTELSCQSLQDVTWENYHNMRTFYENLVLAEIGCWISVAGWCAIFGIGFLRCCLTIDFVAQPTPSSTVALERNVTPGIYFASIF
uniref:Uncharacterized protein n=1 Tax=Strigamia maritima TaxID=126957 RepID=T1J7D5_STRMM